ncbi:MAG TPA: superoxide dismutase family protein [Terriglobales bacterium]
MTNTLLLAAALIALTFTGFASDKPVKKQVVSLKDAKGTDVGTATIKSSGKGVEVKLAVKDLPPGEHALHFHQNAKCDPPDFKSAGPHFNPEKKEHGLLNPKGHHAGDMDNFTVNPNGTSKATVKDPEVVLGTGSEANSLFANGGTALMIHAKADDMKTDPAGNAGDRIACGVITK